MTRFLQMTSHGVQLRVKIQPRAARNAIAGALGDELKLKIAAPPVDSAANEALIAFLADLLECHRRSVEIVHGHKSPHKILRLHGLTLEGAREKLQGSGSP
jgi:uncharacterized protein